MSKRPGLAVCAALAMLAVLAGGCDGAKPKGVTQLAKLNPPGGVEGADCVVSPTGNEVFVVTPGTLRGEQVLSVLSRGQAKQVYVVRGGGRNTSYPMDVHISPNGRLILVVANPSLQCLTVLIDRRTGKELWRSEEDAVGWDSWSAFSKDSSQLLMVRGLQGAQELWLFNAQTCKPVRPLARIGGPDSMSFATVGFLPSGSVAYWREPLGGSIAGWEVHSGSRAKPLAQFGDAAGVHPSPDGRLLVVEWSGCNGKAPAGLVLYDKKGVKIRDLLAPGSAEDLLWPMWSPDGALVAVLVTPRNDSGHWKIAVVDVKSGASVCKYSSENGEVGRFSWYPDSRNLATVVEGETGITIEKITVK